MEVDAKDARILLALAHCKTTSPEDITEETDIPKSTVHYRLQRLREKGILKNELYEVDREKLGLSLTVISEVYAEYEEGYHESVGQKLSRLTGVNQVYFLMGDTDFIVISHLSSHEKVEELISEYETIDEIHRTSSKFVIKTIKARSTVLEDYDQPALIDALDIDQEPDEAENMVGGQ